MERIVTVEGVRAGRPTIAGTRITVAEVLEMFGAGMTEADILESFPQITPDDVRAALAYAAREFDHPVVTAK
ncbi:MAG: DUF433 domain-containing protein [Hyphomonadaceae bacterium]|jgi:uncharacterized protein (DUF433 family)|nr:DUF433 domain-containing protein [Hyphomonadaceae bacterium]